MDRDYAYNRRLFKRLRQGWYQLSPALSIRQSAVEDAAWLPLFEALNLRLIKECAPDLSWWEIDALLGSAGLKPASRPVLAGEIGADEMGRSS